MKRFLVVFFLLTISLIGISQVKSDKDSVKFSRIESNATDYFRSVASGDWSSTITWESSPDNSTWSAATLTPDNIANSVYIRNTHNVIVTSSVTVDQVIIENGGVLTNQIPASNTLTIADGLGDDIEIQSSGIYHILSSQGFANYQTINSGATIRIKSGGTIKVGDGTLFGGSDNHSHAATSTSYIWENASFFEWNSLGSFATSGIIYFPDVNAVTIPVFKTLVNVGNVGATSNTEFKGIFEANGSIIFANSGIKYFRNGIRGTGNISESSSGKFVINGSTAELGGIGSLTLPSLGLEIGSASNATAVTLISNKTITGDISLLSTNNTYVDLGIYDLTVTGSVSGGTTNAYIKTSSTGALTLSSIAPSAVKNFPIGKSSYNPLQITNNDGVTTANFAARVEDVINPGISVPAFGIKRTWNINASANISTADITFQYATADADINATPPQNMEVLLYSGSAWSIIPGQTNIVTGGADPAWTINTNGLGVPIATTATPYILGVNGGWVLPIDCIISTRAQKRNNSGIISWTVNSCSEVSSFEVQLSVNNSGFRTVGTITPAFNETDFNFTDANLSGGTNLYRIKVNRLSGAPKYSNTVAVLHNSNDILITSLAPNPVHNNALITISTAKQIVVDVKVFDMAGHVVKQWQSNIAEGNNTITLNVDGLPAGLYHVLASSADAKAFSRFIKQ